MRTLSFALFAAFFVVAGCDTTAPEAVTAAAHADDIAGPTSTGYNCQSTYYNDSGLPTQNWSVVGRAYAVSQTAFSFTVQATGDSDGTSNHVIKLQTANGISSQLVQHTTTSCTGP